MFGSDSVPGIILPKRTSDDADYSVSLLLPFEYVGSQCNLTVSSLLIGYCIHRRQVWVPGRGTPSRFGACGGRGAGQWRSRGNCGMAGLHTNL